MRSALSGGCENSNDPSSFWSPRCIRFIDVPTRKIPGIRPSREMNVTCEPMFEIAIPIRIPSAPTSYSVPMSTA